jgi:hypothetical protein
MRNTVQTNRLSHIRPILDQGDDASMIDLEKRGQHHQRKQLMLGKILATVPTGVSRQRTLGYLDGLPGQRHRRPRHRACGFHAAMM